MARKGAGNSDQIFLLAESSINNCHPIKKGRNYENRSHAIQPARQLTVAAVLGSMVLPAMAHLPGRMTGGGSIYCGDIGRVTFGFELHCGTGLDPEASNPPVPNNLEINFAGGNHFHLQNLVTASCSRPATSHPSAPISSMLGVGTGTFDGAPATIEFQLTDNGEPGAGVDTASFNIQSGGKDVLICKNTLEGGNIQAHRATGSKQ